MNINPEKYHEKTFLDWFKNRIYEETITNRENKLRTETDFFLKEYIKGNEPQYNHYDFRLPYIDKKIEDLRPDFAKMTKGDRDKIEQYKKDLKTEKQNLKKVENACKAADPNHSTNQPRKIYPAMVPIITRINDLVKKKESLESSFRSHLGLSDELRQALDVHISDLKVLSKNSLRNQIMDVLDLKRKKNLEDYFPHDIHTLTFHLPIMYSYFVSRINDKQKYSGSISEVLAAAKDELLKNQVIDNTQLKKNISALRERFDNFIDENANCDFKDSMYNTQAAYLAMHYVNYKLQRNRKLLDEHSKYMRYLHTAFINHQRGFPEDAVEIFYNNNEDNTSSGDEGENLLELIQERQDNVAPIPMDREYDDDDNDDDLW